MEADSREPSRLERAYDTAITVLVSVFALAIIVGGIFKNGVANVVALKSDFKDLLAFLGVLSLVVVIGTHLLRHLAFIKNSFFRTFIGAGAPLIILTGLYRWIYPTSISFGEYLGCNVMFAVLISFAAKPKSLG